MFTRTYLHPINLLTLRKRSHCCLQHVYGNFLLETIIRQGSLTLLTITIVLFAGHYSSIAYDLSTLF